MGSGKTAVGKHLARLLRAPFRDSDAEIEARTGVDISYIFSREGEAGFRQREREILEDVTREMRTRAKAVNFGVIYGQGDSGLSKSLGIARAEASSTSRGSIAGPALKLNTR